MHPTIRKDLYNGVAIHTFVRKGRPCWLLYEIGLVMRRDLDITCLAPHDEDAEVLSPADADALRAVLEYPANGQALMVIYDVGLALACTMAGPAANGVRRLLLQEAAPDVKRTLRRARLEHRVRETIKQFELEDRTRKAGLLHRLVEHGRRSGPLANDDAAYVTAMALVAETATGLVFPTNAPSDEGIASELDETTDSVRGALVALCEEINA